MQKTFKVLILIINTISSIAYGQSENIGVNFESGLSWREIQAKAKAENKYIFIDCYTTWCGPCKWMSKSVFTQRQVGDFMNKNFISVAIQMDQTIKKILIGKIRKWYSDAKTLTEKFLIQAYPTYLFFSPDGKLVHRFTGSTANGEEFISKVGDVFDQKKQFYTLHSINWKEFFFKEDSIYLFNSLCRLPPTSPGQW